jgi:hypothetical protein
MTPTRRRRLDFAVKWLCTVIPLKLTASLSLVHISRVLATAVKTLARSKTVFFRSGRLFVVVHHGPDRLAKSDSKGNDDRPWRLVIPPPVALPVFTYLAPSRLHLQVLPRHNPHRLTAVVVRRFDRQRQCRSNPPTLVCGGRRFRAARGNQEIGRQRHHRCRLD